jgi:hypothetical protein
MLPKPGCSSDLLKIFYESVGLLELKIAMILVFYGVTRYKYYTKRARRRAPC